MPLATVGNPIFSPDGKIARFNERIFPLPHAFSTMRAGNMSLKWVKTREEEAQTINNMGGFFMQINVRGKKRIHMAPNHGSTITYVSEKVQANTVDADALITFRRDIFLTVCPADCLPIILTCRGCRFVALVHGSAQCLEQHKLLLKTAELLVKEFGANQDDMLVAMGPGIRSDCNVGCYNKDLFYIAAEQLTPERGEGIKVPLSNMFYASGCTCCSTFPGTSEHTFFSHRRSHETGEKEGRFMAFAMLS